MFNVEVGLYDGETSEGGILGLTLSVFVPETLAVDGDCIYAKWRAFGACWGRTADLCQGPENCPKSGLPDDNTDG